MRCFSTISAGLSLFGVLRPAVIRLEGETADALGREYYVRGAAPGVQQGGWPRERLLAMDRRFVERLARAITAGDESPQGAAGLASVR